MGWLGDVGGFVEGTAEGAWDGVKGTAEGVGHLASSTYKFTTNSQYRKQTWDDAVRDAKGVANFAQTAVTNPGKAASETAHAVSGAYDSLKAAYDQAAANGQGSQFFGKMFGQGAVMLGTAFIPGGAEADAVGALGDAGRISELAGDAGKLADVTSDAGKLSDAGNLTDTAGGLASHSEGEIDLGAEPKAPPPAAPQTIRINDTEAFKAAAEHPEPNTTYQSGSYSWTTDAEGRTINAEGTVDLTPAGRDNALQEKIGKEGEPTDVGFHLIGDRFNGPTNRLNVVPGNGKPLTDGLPNLNQGAYKRFENQIAKLASDPHNTVDVRVQPEYNSGNMTNRPDGFTASYRVNGGDWIEREFVNKR